MGDGIRGDTGGYAENGDSKMSNEFEYEGGYRDRRERDFYGFEKVITKQIDTQNGNAVYCLNRL